MPDSKFDVLINFIMKQYGEDAANKLTRQLADLDKEIEINKASLKRSQESLAEWKKELASIKESMKGKWVDKNGEEWKNYQEKVKGANKAIQDNKTLIDIAKKDIKDLTEQRQNLIKTYEDEKSASERATQSQVRNLRLLAKEQILQARELNRTAGDIDRFAKPLAIGGALVVGGIFAAAKKYVDNAKEATVVTREWKRAEDEVSKAGERIGAVLAEQALPLIKDAGKIMTLIANVLEKNPGMAGAALQGGIIALTLGTLGKAVSSGLRLVADFKLDAALGLQMTAAELQLQAARTQVAAATGKSLGGAGGAGGALAAGGGASAAGPLGLAIVGAAALNLGMAKMLDIAEEGLSKATGSAKAASVAIDILARALSQIPGYQLLLPFRELEKNILPGIQRLINGISADTNQATQTSIFGDHADEVVEAYSKMREEELQAIQEFNQARARIIADGAAAIAAANSSYAASVAQINSNYASQIASIMQQAAQAEAQANARYAQERARIVRDGGREIERIEKDHQERMRKLQEEHDQNVADLIDERDALGLYKEQQRFDQAQEEEERNTNDEIAQRREDLKIRLQDLAENFAAERAQRAEQLKQRLAEAAQQHAEQLKREAEQHKQEVERIKKQEAEKLKELNTRFQQERAARQAGFIALVNELTQEVSVRQKAYNQMLKDATAFYQAYMSRLPSGSSGTSTGTLGGHTFPGRQAGGYVGAGLYNLHANEFVMSPSTTRMAEALLGGKLNQQVLLSALTGGGRNISYMDNSRYSTGVGARDRRAIRQQQLEDLNFIFKG